MQQVPLDIKINPSNIDDIETWRNELLWRPQTKDEIVEYVKTHIKSHPEVKSGVVLYRDFALGAFQQISFSSRSITQPEPADAVVRIRKPTNNKKPLTTEEKIDCLKLFIAQHGRFPTEEDKFSDGPNLYLFYKSLIRGRNKYDEIINDCKSDHSIDSGSETTNSGTDDGHDGGRGGILGGRGSDVDDDVPDAPKKAPKRAKK